MAAPVLIVLNGPPGVGKSTMARRYADDHPLALRIDVDDLRDWLGAWRDVPMDAGIRARDLAVTMADDHLRAGYDVVLAQLFGRTAHLERLEAVASARGARFAEIVLLATKEESLDRFVARGGPRLDDAQAKPDGLAEVAELHDRLLAVLEHRPRAVPIQAVADDVDGTYAAVRAAIASATS